MIRPLAAVVLATLYGVTHAAPTPKTKTYGFNYQSTSCHEYDDDNTYRLPHELCITSDDKSHHRQHLAHQNRNTAPCRVGHTTRLLAKVTAKWEVAAITFVA